MKSIWLLLPLALAAAESEQDLGVVSVTQSKTRVIFNAHSNGIGRPAVRGNSMSFGKGKRLYREFTDGKRLEFGYGVEVAEEGDHYVVTIHPLGKEYAEVASPKLIFDREKPPTFITAPQIGVLFPGDKASFEVLRNPATGEVITDTIQVTVPEVIAGEFVNQSGLNVGGLRVLVDGAPLALSNHGSVSCDEDAAVLIYLPKHGAFYLSRKPVAGENFQKIGVVDGGRLTVFIDNRRYEFQSDHDILGLSKTGELWILHELNPPAARWLRNFEDTEIGLAAGTMESFRRK